MIYYCPKCGLRFSTPFLRTSWNNLDGENGWYERREGFCPECRCQEFYEEDMRLDILRVPEEAV